MKFPKHNVSLTLMHNDHKNYYNTAREWCEEYERQDFYTWQSDEHKQRAIDTDEIWTLQWYPETPIGFHAIAAPTLEELLTFAGEYE